MSFSTYETEELIEYLPEALFLEDFDGNILDVNSKACDLLGYEKEELLRQKVEDIVPDEERVLMAEKIEEATRKNEPVETVNICKDGTKVPVELRGRIIEINGEEGILVSVRDITDRIQAKQELEENKQQYQKYFEELGDAVFILAMGGEDHGKILDVNPTAVEQTGYSREELVGMNMLEDLSLGPPSEMDYEEADRKISRGETVSFTEKKRKKNGDEYWTEVVVNPIKYEGREANLSINRDITERKRAEEKLEESEEKYRTIFESAKDAIFIMKGDRIADCNEETLEMFECEREDIVGQTPDDFSPEKQPDGRASAEKAKEKINLALAGDPQSFEWVHTTKNGEPFPAEITLNRYMIEDEKFVMAIVRDVTERKNAEEELRENEKKYRQIFNDANDAIYLHGLTDNGLPGQFIEVNDVASQMLGYSREEFLEMSPLDIDAGERSEEVPDIMEELLSEGHKTFEMVHETKDGRSVPVEVSSHVFEMNGETRVLSVTRDIRERKEKEEQLERYKMAVEGTDDLMAACDQNYNYIFANQAYKSYYSAEDDDIENYKIENLVGSETFENSVKPRVDRCLGGERVEYEMTRSHPSKGDRTLNITYYPLEGEDRIHGVVAVIRDVTERKNTEDALQEERDKLKSLHDAVDELQKQETVDEVAQTAVEVAEEMLDFRFCDISLVEGDYLVPKASATGLGSEESVPFEMGEGITGKTMQKGETIWGDDLRDYPEAKPTNEVFRAFISVPIGELGVFQVISEEVASFTERDVELAEVLIGHLREELMRVRLEEELRQQAVKDPLTDLYNRRYFNESLDKEVERCRRYEEALAFLMIDVNRFKEINDRYSHQTGDEVLREVANLLRNNIRDADTVVRYGGDEFLIMLPETKKVESTVDRIEEGLERWNEESDLLDFPLDLDMGTAFWNPDQDIDVEEVLKEADKKMYEEKNR